jgi:hypothetical protein
MLYRIESTIIQIAPIAAIPAQTARTHNGATSVIPTVPLPNVIAAISQKSTVLPATILLPTTITASSTITTITRPGAATSISTAVAGITRITPD